MDKEKTKELFEFQVDRNFAYLQKNILLLLEDLRDENLVGSEYYGRLRKRVLDYTNDTKREVKAYTDRLF